MSESNLLKEAIADAKAVRQTALANAKVALEEAFSERYSQMFAEKLREDAGMDQPSAPAGDPGMKPEENVSEQEIDELIKELEQDIAGQPEQPDADDAAPEGAPAAPGAMPPPPAPAPMGAPPMGAPMGAPPIGAPAPGACCPACNQPTPPMGGGMDAGMGAPPAPMGAPPMGGGMDAGAPPPPMGGGMDAGAPPPSDVPPAEDEADENIDLNELLESLKEEVEDEEKEETIDEQTKLASSGIATSDNKAPSSSAKSSSRVESGGDKDGMPTIDQPKTVAKEATQAKRPNQASHATKDNLSTPSFGGKGGNGSGGNSETGMPKTDQAKTTAKEATQASRPNQGKNATKDNLSTPGGMLQENETLKTQLREAYETITYVKGQLNEINLLNAKLLYTNKLFKEYNMNNEQKMRIVEMFDLSKNVREVKLTYANIAESLNFGGTDMRKKVTASNASVQSITEGLASKPVGSTKPSKQVITEGSEMVTKFQRLAGIKHAK